MEDKLTWSGFRNVVYGNIPLLNVFQTTYRSGERRNANHMATAADSINGFMFQLAAKKITGIRKKIIISKNPEKKSIIYNIKK